MDALVGTLQAKVIAALKTQEHSVTVGNPFRGGLDREP